MPLIQEAKIITRHYSKIARLWVPTIGAWGTAGGAVLLYLTDWKVIMKHVPYVGKKYDHESPRTKYLYY